MASSRKGRGVNAKGRSKRGEQFVPVPYPMAHSAAWRSLSGPAVKVYVELRSRFNGGNNGELSLSLDEASRLLGISKSTAKRAFAELKEKGFILETRKGSWYGRLASLYAVTDRSLNGHLPTNDWKVWHPPEKTDPRYRDGTVEVADGAVCVPKES